MTTLIPKFDLKDGGSTPVGAINRPINEKLTDTISVKDFGAVGDGTTDDSAAIQTAISYGFANKLNIYFPTATYAIGTTLIIPQLFDGTFVSNPSLTIDCGNSNFKMLADTVLFTSGYDNSGTLTTNYGTTLDAHFSQGITLCNFYVTSNVSYLTQPVFKIQDWHQSCLIENVSSIVSEQMLWSNNNYYCTFNNINGSFSDSPAAGDRFIFFNNHNLNKISNCVAGNSITGYRFDGAVTACQFTNNSVEGVTYGLVFNATVYDISIENCYFENIDDTAVAFDDAVLGAKLTNNYINFLSSATTYFVYYFPAPGSVVSIDQSNYLANMPSNANIIKVAENTYGQGVIIQRPKESSSSLSTLLVDNSIIGQNIDWQQKQFLGGAVANVINKYVPGNYSGKYSNGISGANGFSWTNLSSGTIQINTRISYSNTQRIYVNLVVTASGSTAIRGEFMSSFSATTFYEYTGAGISVTTALDVTNVGGFVQINGTVAGTITAIDGEVRLI